MIRAVSACISVRSRGGWQLGGRVDRRPEPRTRSVIVGLRAEIEGLRSRNAALEARLGKDSGNSSTPPSRDGRDRRVRRAEEREARKKALIDSGGGVDRPSGKQPAAPGATLQRSTADRTITYPPGSCGRCSASLNAAVVGTPTRRALDIPRPRVEVVDHGVEKRRCARGPVTAGVFPTEATSPTCWAPRIKAVAVYLMIRQHIPLERAHEAVAVLFDAPLSEGTLAGLSGGCRWTSRPVHDRARRSDPLQRGGVRR